MQLRHGLLANRRMAQPICIFLISWPWSYLKLYSKSFRFAQLPDRSHPVDMRTLIKFRAIYWRIVWLICALIVSGAERRDALFTVTSHQADVIERISGQRTAQHDDVTFQLGHLQVSNKSAASAVLSSTLSSEQRTLSFFGNAITDYCYHLIFFSSRVAVAECIFFDCENLTSSFFLHFYASFSCIQPFVNVQCKN